MIYICVKVTLIIYSFYIVFYVLKSLYTCMIYCLIKFAEIYFNSLDELFIPDISYVDKLLFFVNFLLYRYTVYVLFAHKSYLFKLL